MSVVSILNRPGRTWTVEERQAVLEWVGCELLDQLIQRASRCIAGDSSADKQWDRAYEVVDAVLIDVFSRRLHAYYPIPCLEGARSFNNWLQQMVMRRAWRFV